MKTEQGIGIITTNAHRLLIARQELIDLLTREVRELYIFGDTVESNRTIISNDGRIHFINISVGRKMKSIIEELTSLIRLVREIKRSRVSRMIIYGVRMIPICSIASKFAGVERIVCVVNGAGRLFMNTSKKPNLVHSLGIIGVKLGLAISDSTIFQNKDDMAEFTANKLVNPSRCKLANGSGVNLNKFREAELPNETAFLMLSRITKTKGVMEYLLAAEYINRIYPRVSFSLVGPKDDEDFELDWEYINRINRLGIVKVLPETDDVLSHYQVASVFIFPSFYREGVPRCSLEAAAVGRPIITTNVNGCKETVIHRYNGIIIPPRDVEALIKAMTYMIENPNEIKRMGRNSRILAENKFDIKRINKIYIDEILRMEN